MTAFGVFLVASGLPCMGLGVYFRRQSPAAGDKGGGGKKGKKKGKDDGGKGSRPPEGGSLIWGGALFAIAGVGLIVADQLK